MGLQRDLDIALELPSVVTILRYVNAGFGATILPDFALGESSRNGSFRVQPMGSRIPPIEICVSWTKKGVLSRAAELLLQMLRDDFRDSRPQRNG